MTSRKTESSFEKSAVVVIRSIISTPHRRVDCPNSTTGNLDRDFFDSVKGGKRKPFVRKSPNNLKKQHEKARLNCRVGTC